MEKYIVELYDENVRSVDGYDWLQLLISVADKSVMVETAIQLLPYTESDMGKEAYQKGYEDAAVKISSDEQAIAEKAYQSGLSDAWEAARKISMAEINGRCSWKSMKNIFGIDIPSKIFKNFTASESIEKLKAYEQEQGTEIKVGNEVKAFEKKPFIVTGIGYGYDEKDVYYHGFVTENGISTSAKKDECVKTGRYFPEIAEVMRKMKESQ